MASDILNKIAERTKTRIDAAYPDAAAKEQLREKALQTPAVPSFCAALKKPGLSFICEVKKASPSKGLIAEEFPYLQIAEEYAEAGASAISVLTEPEFFLGSDRYLREITETVQIPVLRKDFTISPLMLYEARALGASAILLICSLLSPESLKEYLQLAEELSLDALVEAHDENEIEMAVSAGAAIIGVNNRNLKDFSVDFENTIRLRSLIPKDRVMVAESGVKGPEDVARIRAAGADAVLIGELLMRSEDRKGLLRSLRA